MSKTAYADRTIAAYRWRVKETIKNWSASWKASPFLRDFVKALPSGAQVLDYGCGIGIEMAWMRRQGLRVEGIDGTVEFVKESRRRCPGVKIIQARFGGVHLPAHAYDGIWCNAALIHVPPEEIREQLEKLRQSLKSDGLLGLTLAWGRRKGFTLQDWIPGRYIAGYMKEELQNFLQEWKIREFTITSHAGREGRWIQILASPFFSFK